MSKYNIETEPLDDTLLRLLMVRHTVGWIVNKLAEFQEELHNTDCADMLRTIVAERSGVPYVACETSRSLRERRAQSREFEEHFSVGIDR